uniref:Mobile element protein n=1 Tax=Strongyloides venezuelensis TaxID=75913 RepID=A0A0K0ETT0_STRVS
MSINKPKTVTLTLLFPTQCFDTLISKILVSYKLNFIYSIITSHTT